MFFVLGRMLCTFLKIIAQFPERVASFGLEQKVVLSQNPTLYFHRHRQGSLAAWCEPVLVPFSSLLSYTFIRVFHVESHPPNRTGDISFQKRISGRYHDASAKPDCPARSRSKQG